jgi:hypothetical protein
LEVQLIDLPGTYSLTAYSLEELVARNVLVDERPDVVVDIAEQEVAAVAAPRGLPEADQEKLLEEKTAKIEARQGEAVLEHSVAVCERCGHLMLRLDHDLLAPYFDHLDRKVQSETSAKFV